MRQTDKIAAIDTESGVKKRNELIFTTEDESIAILIEIASKRFILMFTGSIELSARLFYYIARSFSRIFHS